MSTRTPARSVAARLLPAGAVAGCLLWYSLVTTPPEIVGTALEGVLGSVPVVDVATTSESVLRGSQTMALSATEPTEIPTAAATHFLAYAAFSLTLSYALAPTRLSRTRKALLVFAIATGYGACLEGLQLLHPERVGSLTDVGINALGAAAGLVWYVRVP